MIIANAGMNRVNCQAAFYAEYDIVINEKIIVPTNGFARRCLIVGMCHYHWF